MTKVAVFDSALSIISKDQLNTGSENFYKVHFTFNSTWDNCTKHAVFYQVLTQTPFECEIDEETHIVEIPNELLVVDLPLFIGAFGEKEDGTIISTNFKGVPIKRGAFVDDYISFKNTAASIVRSTDTKIKYIRVGANDHFEYSTDGIIWKQVIGQNDDYTGIFQKIAEVAGDVSALEERVKALEETPPALDLTAGDRISIVGQVISVKDVERKYIRTFAKSNFLYDSSNKCYYFEIIQSEHGFSNPYISNVYATRVVKNTGTVVISKETSITYTDTIDSNGNIRLYVSIDLSALTEYNGKIIIKGD